MGSCCSCCCKKKVTPLPERPPREELPLIDARLFALSTYRADEFVSKGTGLYTGLQQEVGTLEAEIERARSYRKELGAHASRRFSPHREQTACGL
eukprot:SAG31_NODE_42_length_31262_cov_46.416231_5_plen_95_part_00